MNIEFPALPRATNALTTKADGNPDGKAANGFLLDWIRCNPRDVVAKPKQQVLAEFFTSMLALSAEFKYRPAVGSSNYLYWIDGQWSLSLISPDEWSAERRAGFAGMLVLQRDMTWTITPSEQLRESSPVSDALRRSYDAFVDTLDTDQTLEEVLPFHVRGFAYYQRLYASALSRSIAATLSLGNQASTGCRQWRVRLPRPNNALLANPA